MIQVSQNIINLYLIGQDLDNEQSQPKGSMAHQMGVGVETEKGKQVTEEDNGDDEGGSEYEPNLDLNNPIYGIQRKDLLLVNAESIGTLPQSPHQKQMYIPHSSLTDYPRDQKMEEECLVRALIESMFNVLLLIINCNDLGVKDEMNVTRSDDEINFLQKRLDELYQQAKGLGLDITPE